MQFSLAIHGGAGTLPPDATTPPVDAALRAGLRQALAAGHAILAAGGSALDAVQAAVAALEDDPQFNAGIGAVYTSAGRHEMDAAVMDGRTGRAGAVAGVCGPRSPVAAARAVMDHSPHLLLAGEGAHAFLRHHVPFADPAIFATDRRWQALQAVLAATTTRADDADRHGTVGAVARDASGGLAAATSTGGMTGKRPGRIGDTPLVGAGTWASAHCAVSCTGDGEVFIRAAAAHELDARLRLAGENLDAAAAAVIAAVGALGGSGGLIAVDAAGRVAMPFNSRGMYRGSAGPDGIAWTAIFGEAPRQAGPPL